MNGILNVYKEKGYTSFDVVAKLRGICHQKKIGHTGTLDPDAEGALPVCLGTATKVCGLLTDKDKEYEATLLLGKETDTQDIGGKTLRECEVRCSEEEVRKAAASFVGEYSQVPPMYSALKVNGKKLCDLARAGLEVERKPRSVQIYQLEIGQIRLPRVKLRVHCSKGTYIRTLCDDIGKKLGCGGCMESLVRTRSGIFLASEAVKLSEIQELAESGQLEKLLIPADRLFLGYPAVSVCQEFQKLLINGNRLPKRAFFIEENLETENAINGSFIEKNSIGKNSIKRNPVGENVGQADSKRLRVYLKKEFFGIYMQDHVHGGYKPQTIFWRGNGTGDEIQK